MESLRVMAAENDFNPRSREGSDFFDIYLITIGIISIHAPARGATQKAILNLSNQTDFNPRSREGSDKKAAVVCAEFVDFNPRSREGSDRMILRPLPELTKFQSTLPRGERHGKIKSW